VFLLSFCAEESCVLAFGAAELSGGWKQERIVLLRLIPCIFSQMLLVIADWRKLRSAEYRDSPCHTSLEKDWMDRASGTQGGKRNTFRISVRTLEGRSLGGRPTSIILPCIWKKCGPGSSVGIVTDYGIDGPGIESRWRARFSAPVQTGLRAHRSSCTMGTGSFLGVKYGRGVMLTTHPLLVPWSWKSRAIPLPTFWATPGL
jgi:hypothetical protein